MFAKITAANFHRGRGAEKRVDSFKLTPDTMKRLTAQFKAFLSDREKIHALLGDYVADYRSFKGTALARQEYLREKYAARAPNFTHLLPGVDGELYWGAADIAILLGRDPTTITRMMRTIESGGWRSRLYELRRPSKAGAFVYQKGIFDLIIDFYEEEYLQRFVAPRRGETAGEEEKAEIYRFWNMLKLRAQNDREFFLRDGMADVPVDLPELPPLTLKEILRLIVAKTFNIKMGALFTVLFAFCYELSRRWNFFYLWVPALFAAVLVACVFGIRRGKFNPDHLVNVGAGALLFCFLWLVGVMANDGVVHTPRGPVGAPPASEKSFEKRIAVSPHVLNDDRGVSFIVEVEDIREVKEIFYRVEPQTEYRTTGPMPQTNPATGLPYPNLIIWSGEKRGVAKIDVKYTDLGGAEWGPYGFAFDLDRLFLEATKKSLSDGIPGKDAFWFGVAEDGDITRINLNPYSFNMTARAGIEKIMYGLNKETPDAEWPTDGANVTVEKKIQYISAQIFFRDGASTDIKIFDAKR
jgi:hypothetical protein